MICRFVNLFHQRFRANAWIFNGNLNAGASAMNMRMRVCVSGAVLQNGQSITWTWLYTWIHILLRHPYKFSIFLEEPGLFPCRNLVRFSQYLPPHLTVPLPIRGTSAVRWLWIYIKIKKRNARKERSEKQSSMLVELFSRSPRRKASWNVSKLFVRRGSRPSCFLRALAQSVRFVV